MRYITTFLLTILACFSLDAQYVVSDKYKLWFEDSGHEITTRKQVACYENYQDLWNGAYVKIAGKTVYIYQDNRSILYGEKIYLLYNGYYKVKKDTTWYLADEGGHIVQGVYGREMKVFPWGYVTVKRTDNYWGIFHCSGQKVNCYSNEPPRIFWNGCWIVKQGRYWYACHEDGSKISGVYGDKVTLTQDGRWKCVRGSYVTYIKE